jgi:hypothetical protein
MAPRPITTTSHVIIACQYSVSEIRIVSGRHL